ncbi:MAG: hypothetical protein KatS3mg028_0598 [Bacteroidia bacterium]|nr:MAG: hypothetical protein KatS3mg028_0598 [Bacteroidia bacterium]
MKHLFAFILLLLILLLSSCSKPAETKEEFIQKGIIMSDTLLKNLDARLKNAELTVDSAIKLGYFVPPPPPTPSITNTDTSKNK